MALCLCQAITLLQSEVSELDWHSSSRAHLTLVISFLDFKQVVWSLEFESQWDRGPLCLEFACSPCRLIWDSEGPPTWIHPSFTQNDHFLTNHFCHPHGSTESAEVSGSDCWLTANLCLMCVPDIPADTMLHWWVQNGLDNEWMDGCLMDGWIDAVRHWALLGMNRNNLSDDLIVNSVLCVGPYATCIKALVRAGRAIMNGPIMTIIMLLTWLLL